MTKNDFKKELRHLYNPSAKKIEIVDVPALNFLMIDGVGDPNTAQEYRDAVEALFAVSYTLKFMVKKSKGVDYGVLPLEGLWRSLNRRRPGSEETGRANTLKRKMGKTRPNTPMIR